MGVAGDIYLGLSGAEAILPDADRKVIPEDIEITKTTRTADGTLFEQVIRRYTNYTINHEALIGTDYDIIKALYDLNQNLSLIVYDRTGTPITSTIKMHPISATRDSTAGDWIYKGVSYYLEVV